MKLVLVSAAVIIMISSCSSDDPPTTADRVAHLEDVVNDAGGDFGSTRSLVGFAEERCALDSFDTIAAITAGMSQRDQDVARAVIEGWCPEWLNDWDDAMAEAG